MKCRLGIGIWGHVLGPENADLMMCYVLVLGQWKHECKTKGNDNMKITKQS